jgi:hypothetical protein
MISSPVILFPKGESIKKKYLAHRVKTAQDILGVFLIDEKESLESAFS